MKIDESLKPLSQIYIASSILWLMKFIDVDLRFLKN